MKSYDAVLVDAGTGNLHSVHNALLASGFDILVTSDPRHVGTGSRIILPGVGAFASFMDGLRQRRLEDALHIATRRGIPILGICVGMQALFVTSEEKGEHPGLGLLPGRVKRFPPLGDLKVPHTGWNQLWMQNPSPIFDDIPAGSYAYFNHSYYCDPTDQTPVSASTDYGISFTSAVQDGNLFGVQFHPEKSQRVGQQLLKNFMKIAL